MPTKWSATENVAWNVEIPGVGHASPIVWEDRIFVVTCDTDKKERLLLCLDRRSGRTLWKQVVIKSALENIHKLNSRASSTPVTDGKLVYVTFLEMDGKEVPFKPGRFITPGKMVVAAYTFAGELRWKVRPGDFSSIHGYCSHPVLFEDKVIVNGDHDGDSYIVALKCATGETIWKTPRKNRTRSYSTPIIRQIDGRTQMILSGDKCVASYDPRDGSQHWVIDGPTEQYVASIVYNGDLLFMTAGFPERHMLAIRPDGYGNVTDTHIVWRTRRACSYVPSPIAAGDYFLVVSDNGIGTCFEAKSGNPAWQERLGRHYSASLVSAAGLVYFTDDDGITKVVRPGASYDLVAENKLGEHCYASPAVSQGQIFIRTEKNLIAIGK